MMLIRFLVLLTLLPMGSQTRAAGENPAEVVTAVSAEQAAVEQAERQAARESITEFNAALLAALRSGAGFQQRLEILTPAIRAYFNVPTIARLSVGRTWRSLDEQSREQFQIALRDLIAATYADRFDTDSGQAFKLLKVTPGRRGPVVRTQLVRQTGAPVPLDYHFRDGKIYNVVADGVSDLSLRRADYNSIIKQQGFPALLSHINQQLADLLYAGGDPSEPVAGATTTTADGNEQ